MINFQVGDTLFHKIAGTYLRYTVTKIINNVTIQAMDENRRFASGVTPIVSLNAEAIRNRIGNSWTHKPVQHLPEELFNV